MKTKKISWQAIAIVVLALVLIASIALGVSGAWFQDSDSGKSEATLGHAITVKLQDVDGSTGTDGIESWSSIYDSSKTYAYPGDQIIGKTRIQMSSTSPSLIRVSVVPEVWEKVSKDTTGDGLIEVKDDTNTNVLYKLKKVDFSTAVTLGNIGSDEGAVAAPTSITGDLTAYYNALIALKDTDESSYAENAEKWNKWLLQNMTASLNLKAPADSAAGWLKGADGLWYYSQVYGNVDALSTDAANTIDLFESASLSPYLTNEVAQWKVSVDLKVEAIQAAHADERGPNAHPWNAELVKTELKALYGKSAEELTSGESNATTTVLGYNAARKVTSTTGATE